MKPALAKSTRLCLALAAAFCAAPDAFRASEAAEQAALVPAATVSQDTVAQNIDAMLDRELGRSPAASDSVDDQGFIRRATQDLIGELPTPDEVTAFGLDPSVDKRALLVDRLLADERFGRHWGRYFRDVILYRRTDERALIAAPALTDFLAGQFNTGIGWDRTARAMITATGDVRENGETGLIMAQMGQAPEIAAETARIFLGIQIQCAQCHDHPTDRWKRTQFHELAAFFPRVAIRPKRDGDTRSFVVVSRDAGGRPRPDGKPRNTTEHYMPDLNDPAAQGTLMQPVFFVTGQQLEPGAKDVDRRTALADWITERQNRWFARAFVNRLWFELVGQGFYDPIDDLGPARTATAPQTLDLLAGAFVEQGYDVKWLLRTITATAAYQRDGRAQHDGKASDVACACPQPLRADQVFDALLVALGIDESRFNPPGPPRPAGRRGPRSEFDRTFGFDPSTPRDEVGASIPQALLLMNSPLVNRAIDAKASGNVLSALLELHDDEEIVSELYLRCLAREPRAEESAACLAYVGRVGNRDEAFEDIFWALVNTTEFTQRR